MKGVASVYPADAIPNVHPFFRRRSSSLNSFDAKNTITRFSLDELKKFLPKWLYRVLLFGGGLTGNEPMVIKALLVFCQLGNIAAIMPILWLLGLPTVPDGLVLYIYCVMFGIVILKVRWRFLQSGILWSMAKTVDPADKVLTICSSKCLQVVVFNQIESALLYGVLMFLGLYQDIGGRSESLGTSQTTCILAGGFLGMTILCPICHLTIKVMPLLFVATYDLLVEDFRCFHRQVGAMFTEDSDTESASTGWGAKLHEDEHALRTRVAWVNDVLSPALGTMLSMFLAAMCICSIFGIMSMKRGSNEANILAGVYFFITLMNFLLTVLVLQAAATVGDTWMTVVDDLDTPMICIRSASVLHIPLAERLRKIQNVGIQVWGCAVTSHTVFSLAMTMGSGLFLAVLGTLLTSA